MKHTYKMPLDSTVEIDSETGEIDVTTHLSRLAEEVRTDNATSYTDEEVESDAVTVTDRLLDSPFNLDFTHHMTPFD